jgi:hypothetical protein
MVVALVAALRRLAAGGRPEDDITYLPTPERIAIRPEIDGFWIDDPSLPAGTGLRFRCRVGDEAREDRFTIAPGHNGRFVYTGGTPVEIEILEIQAPPSAAETGMDREPDPRRPSRSRPTRPWTRPTTRPFRSRRHDPSPGGSRHPPAY